VQVEWEFWTNSNDECGVLCDKQRKFIKVRTGLRRLRHSGFIKDYLQAPSAYAVLPQTQGCVCWSQQALPAVSGDWRLAASHDGPHISVVLAALKLLMLCIAVAADHTSRCLCRTSSLFPSSWSQQVWSASSHTISSGCASLVLTQRSAKPSASAMAPTAVRTLMTTSLKATQGQMSSW